MNLLRSNLPGLNRRGADTLVPTTESLSVGEVVASVAATESDAAGAAFARVLSIEPNTPYFVESDEERKMFCLVSDKPGVRAELLVSASHGANARYLAYKHRLDLLKKVTYIERRVSVDELVRIYRDAAVATNGDNYEREQRSMLGYIQEAADLSASDLRIYIRGNNTSIRYKVHGRGRTVHRLTRDEGYKLARALYNGMSQGGDSQLDELKEQDGQLKQEFADQCGLIGTRIATRPAKQRGLLLTLRLNTDTDDETATLESSGYLPEQIEGYDYVLDRPSGSLWLSGVTGSGKTTSLATMLRRVEAREHDELDIVTVEDPIETNMQSDGIFQTPLVYNRNSLQDAVEAWPRGIKSLMRHAPNGIMPGEVREKAAAEAVLDFVMTGHLSLTTIHVDRFFNIPIRLIEMGVTKSIALNPALMTALSNQALVRILCPDCKRPLREHRKDLKPATLARLEKVAALPGAGDIDSLFIAAPRGQRCTTCSGKTAIRRKVANELCLPDSYFMKFLRDEDPLGGLRYWVNECNGTTKLAHAMTYMWAGDADPEHVERDVLPLDEDIRTLGLKP